MNDVKLIWVDIFVLKWFSKKWKLLNRFILVFLCKILVNDDVMLRN